MELAANASVDCRTKLCFRICTGSFYLDRLHLSSEDLTILALHLGQDCAARAWSTPGLLTWIALFPASPRIVLPISGIIAASSVVMKTACGGCRNLRTGATAAARSWPTAGRGMQLAATGLTSAAAAARPWSVLWSVAQLRQLRLAMGVHERFLVSASSIGASSESGSTAAAAVATAAAAASTASHGSRCGGDCRHIGRAALLRSHRRLQRGRSPRGGRRCRRSVARAVPPDLWRSLRHSQSDTSASACSRRHVKRFMFLWRRLSRLLTLFCAHVGQSDAYGAGELKWRALWISLLRVHLMYDLLLGVPGVPLWRKTSKSLSSLSLSKPQTSQLHNATNSYKPHRAFQDS